MTTARMIWQQEYSKARRLNRAFPAKVDPVRFAAFNVLRMGFGPVFGQLFPGTFSPAAAASAAPWWYVTGKTCVAAYQPKGAASLAASYVNLANPGTHDAAPGVAPTWASGTGWTFGGVNYLITTLVPVMDTTWSMFARFDFSSGGTYPTVCGVRNGISGGQNQDFIISADDGVSGALGKNVIRNGQGNTGYLFDPAREGVVGFSGLTAYANGASFGNIISSSCTNSRALYIGCMNDQGGPRYFFRGTIQAVAIYSATLTAGEVATVSAAMAAL